MTDLREMSAVDLLTYLDRHDAPHVSTLRNALAVGHPCTEWVEGRTKALEGRHGMAVRDIAVALAEAKAGPLTPPLTGEEWNALPLIGGAPIVQDRDSVPQWTAFAERVMAAPDVWRTVGWYARQRDPRDTIEALLAAGRGPLYAMDLLTRAIDTEVPPDAYGWDVTPSQFTDLATAGVRDAEEVNLYLRALFGLAVDKWQTTIDLARGGVPGTVAVAARERTEVPLSAWVERFGGIPATAVEMRRPPDADGAAADVLRPYWAAEWTLDDVAYVARAGWKRLRLNSLRSIYYGNGSRSRGTFYLNGALARQMADAGMAGDALKGWLTAITEGGRQEGAPPALHAYQKVTSDTVFAILALHARGVRASHIGTWRRAGARSMADIGEALDAGISVKRAAALADEHGGKLARYVAHGSKPCIRDLRTLIHLHVTHPEETPVSDPSTGKGPAPGPSNSTLEATHVSCLDCGTVQAIEPGAPTVCDVDEGHAIEAQHRTREPLGYDDDADTYEAPPNGSGDYVYYAREVWE